MWKQTKEHTGILQQSEMYCRLSVSQTYLWPSIRSSNIRYSLQFRYLPCYCLNIENNRF